MSINQYYKERIFQPAGLTRTFYDLSNGMVSSPLPHPPPLCTVQHGNPQDQRSQLHMADAFSKLLRSGAGASAVMAHQQPWFRECPVARSLACLYGSRWASMHIGRHLQLRGLDRVACRVMNLTLMLPPLCQRLALMSCAVF